MVNLFIYFLLSFTFLLQKSSAQSDVSLQDGPLSQPVCWEGELDGMAYFPSVPIVLGSVNLRDKEVHSTAQLL